VAGITLSRREQEVAALVAAGLTNREIAARLSIAERTAEYHVEQIRNKLGFRSRVHIASWFAEQETGGASAPGNLPVQLTSFVGRDREIKQVQRLVAENRLVSLVGPPGIGKTRLALQVAARIAPRFRDGCWVIELAPIVDGAQVAPALATAVKIAERPGEDLLETVASALRARRALLVLDNCEHLLDAAAAAAESILRTCPAISILATTRQPIRATGEVVYRTPPLAEAERLFCERAVHSAPDFEMTPAVAAVCRHLEGLPLAIELAAGRVSLMSTDELAAGLNRSLQLLTSGIRTTARRQQSLRAAIDWSHHLLTLDERLLFARLSVFAGGFRLGAAEAVCGEGLREVGELALGLSDKSMVSPLARAGRSTRYRLLETLRQYAAERLVESGELDRTRRLHFKFYLDLTESDSAWRPIGHTQEVALDRTEEEIANLRAALEWSRTNDPSGHLRLANSMSYFWLRRGSTVEGRAWMEPALAASADRGQTRADALWAVAMMAGRQGDAEASRRYNLEAIDIYREIENWGQLARALNNLSVVTQDSVTAQDYVVEGLEYARRSQDRGVLALLLNNSGQRLRAEGQVAAARAAVDESLALSRLDGHEWAIARSLLALAHLALDAGDRKSERVYLGEALEIVHRLGDSWGLAQVFEAFARRSADPARVLRLSGSARALRDRTGDLALAPAHSPEVEEHLNSARSQLGLRAAEIEAAGYAMTLDEAVTEARSEP
jgi:predicted ATPase/DNA-binding CsgD family transcriptional regulator